jgi:two-component system phosphate regulon sensor histidine kinase PhoR
MYYPFSWSKNIVQLTIFVILIIVLGGMFDDFVLAVALATIAILGFNFYQLYKLNQWVWHSKKTLPAQSLRSMGIHLRRYLSATTPSTG